MSAVPKKKHTRSRSNKRKNAPQKKKELGSMSRCPSCKKYKWPHRACPHCGFYK